MNVQEDTLCTGHCSIEHDRKSEEIGIKCNAEHNVGLYKTHIKKSLSLGSGLDRRGRVCNGNDLDSETDLGFSDNGTHDQSGSVISTGEKDPEFSPSNRCLEAPNSVSLQVNSDMVNNESVFAIGDPQQSEKGDYYGNFDIQFPGECSNTPRIPHYIVMSRSLPNMVSYGGHSTTVNIVPRVRSCEDLSVFGLKQNKMLVHKVGTQGKIG